MHGRESLEMAKKNLKKLVDSGVKCGFGTDTGPPRRIQGYFEQWEMELMADAGAKTSPQKGKWADDRARRQSARQHQEHPNHRMRLDRGEIR
jgi:hypothetical protein